MPSEASGDVDDDGSGPGDSDAFTICRADSWLLEGDCGTVSESDRSQLSLRRAQGIPAETARARDCSLLP